MGADGRLFVVGVRVLVQVRGGAVAVIIIIIIAILILIINRIRVADGFAIGVEPGIVPVHEEELHLCAEAEVLGVAGDAVPLHGAAVQTLLDGGEVAKVHPVDEEVHGARVGHGQEEDGVVWGARHQTREAVGGDAGGGCGWGGGEHEIEWQGATEEAPEVAGVGS